MISNIVERVAPKYTRKLKFNVTLAVDEEKSTSLRSFMYFAVVNNYNFTNCLITAYVTFYCFVNKEKNYLNIR